MKVVEPEPKRNTRPSPAGSKAELTARGLLAVLAAYSGGIGALAVLMPHSFYRNVVGVDLLGPYNQHLVSDVGGLYLGFALLFCWAALRPARELVRAGSAAFTLTQAIHLFYHLMHLQPFTAGPAAEQIAGLLPLLLVPLAVLGLTQQVTSQEDFRRWRDRSNRAPACCQTDSERGARSSR